ncbi:bifunctional adenosylcobinamide kinase/adenosylcobinamide-phosphate guanylyltransferase [Caenimonas sedimenti]|uniref:Bifunctional adenosylcobalamin biosynthesis protein n=1 Tax=Caenimonas sedimenti TaxID=2596921 RepID=A0A562ZT47_9BURK|nr:bifunctional adenosylcobinamide kinase/adenosylcobinamide-phosphate guanylyltransferase [Caenimonas sedimenti]TWO71577.1 bifunctional adenosylcobinamide kinase/adenosylcobinamide-phosphate guanylyltransferase [Caenimonas sedimenti]
MADLQVARSELILGGQKSGKTARAESLAAAWLALSDQHQAVYIATAQAWDDEMRDRIARHRLDRARRVPRMATVEEPLALAHAIGMHSDAGTLVVVDCLTLWLTAMLMPAAGEGVTRVRPHPSPPPEGEGAIQDSLPLRGRAGVGAPGADLLTDAIAACAGPLILISNEIGLGVIPMGRDVRTFVDALGSLNQAAAAACERVTLMSAGLPLPLKGEP